MRLGFGYGGYGYEGGFALIVVLFILLIIIGAQVLVIMVNLE
ncbi:YjcZ family sporulation protein [Bacillus sp. DJP31]